MNRQCFESRALQFVGKTVSHAAKQFLKEGGQKLAALLEKKMMCTVGGGRNLQIPREKDCLCSNAPATVTELKAKLNGDAQNFRYSVRSVRKISKSKY